VCVLEVRPPRRAGGGGADEGGAAGGHLLMVQRAAGGLLGGARSPACACAAGRGRASKRRACAWPAPQGGTARMLGMQSTSRTRCGGALLRAGAAASLPGWQLLARMFHVQKHESSRLAAIQTEARKM